MAEPRRNFLKQIGAAFVGGGYALAHPEAGIAVENNKGMSGSAFQGAEPIQGVGILRYPDEVYDLGNGQRTTAKGTLPRNVASTFDRALFSFFLATVTAVARTSGTSALRAAQWIK